MSSDESEIESDEEEREKRWFWTQFNKYIYYKSLALGREEGVHHTHG